MVDGVRAGGGERNVEVRFESGREVLSAYWGFLSGGGLVFPHERLPIGEKVSVDVHISSGGIRHALSGRVVRADDGVVAVAFAPGEPHEMLVSDALAEADRVPARAARRYRIERHAYIEEAPSGSRAPTAPEPLPDTAVAWLINLSDTGCCVRFAHSEEFGLGTSVVLRTSDLVVRGEVVWEHLKERGIRFFETVAAERYASGLRAVAAR